ncbi:iron-sulfur cluster repair di-iron protein [Flavisolibacter ginsenosidimutans]
MVRDDYRLADVFKKWGINYCCGGNLPLQEACAAKNINLELLETELNEATKTISLPNALQFNEWPVLFLLDYIIYVHHSYLKKAIPLLTQTLNSFVAGHLKKYPYLAAVEETFQNLAAVLLEHTEAEEESIFPYLKQVSNTYERKEAYGHLFVRTMRKPLVETISKEHNRVSSLLLSLRQQTNNYRFTDDACTNHRVIYHKLKAFDADLTQHTHLENNVLYPKVLAMEKTLLQV